MTEGFIYSCSQTNLTEFSIWLSQLIDSDNLKLTIKAHNDIEQQLIDEPTGPKRTELVRRLYLIRNNA